MKVKQLSNSSTIESFSYLNYFNNINSAYIYQCFISLPDHNRRGMQVLVSKHNFRVDTGVITPLMHWSAFCVGLEAVNATFVLYSNGNKWQRWSPSHANKNYN
ncbi:hypothetical protein SK128_003070 [Halocaridina rubra]|uniref:Uncharacterized protein n=1 Tax=Halocaridina rubra TaxID=373956 RepID=A0AAN8WK12_HALRR